MKRFKSKQTCFCPGTVDRYKLDYILTHNPLAFINFDEYGLIVYYDKEEAFKYAKPNAVNIKTGKVAVLLNGKFVLDP